MSKAILLCDVQIDLNEGIYKKVSEQARVISEIFGECVLVSNLKRQCTSVFFERGFEKKKCSNKNFYEKVNQELEDCSVVYIRHMLPSFRQLFLIMKIKRRKCRLFYEIPTYPYFGEQFKVSNHKIRTTIRIIIDCLAWPFIYIFVDSLIAIRSNSKVKIYKKMYLIPNGIAKSNIHPFKFVEHNKCINICVVGTLYSYHGVDRMLNAFDDYYADNVMSQVNLHVVGESNEIERLKQDVKKRKIPNVFFYGKMNVMELVDFYSKMDAGVGCLALYRRNADIDTTLKVVEYLCYGLPVISSGSFPVKNQNLDKIRIAVSNNNDNLNLKDILNRFSKINIHDRYESQKIALSNLTWNCIIRKIMNDNG